MKKISIIALIMLLSAPLCCFAKNISFETLQLYYSADSGVTWQKSSKISRIESQWFTVRHTFPIGTNFIYRVGSGKDVIGYINHIINQDQRYDVVEVGIANEPCSIKGICQFQGMECYYQKVKTFQTNESISAIVSSIYGKFSSETKIFIIATSKKFGQHYPAFILKDLIDSNNCGTLGVFYTKPEEFCFGLVNSVYQEKVIFCLIPKHWIKNHSCDTFWKKFIDPIMMR